MITISKATTPKRPTDRVLFSAGSVPKRAHGGNRNQKHIHPMNTLILAEITGNITSALGLLGAAIGVGLIGTKAAEAVGRNPGAATKILVQAIIGMALAEGLGVLALFLA